VKDILDNEHIVWFTEHEQFKPGEEIRLYRKTDGIYNWERENQIVPQERMQGRGVERIGGKAKGLRELEEHKYPTPDRFALETSVLRRIIDDLGLRGELEKLDQLSPTSTIKKIAAVTNKFREKLLNLHETDSHIPDLKEALDRIGGNLFAVRSSAILEDGKVSLAGFFHTELNVTRKGLRKAILEVLASAVDPLAVKSALGRDIKPSETAMAVIIQKMIPGPTGTIFTKNHVTGDERVVRIEVARFPKQIVDGEAAEADAQLISIDKRTGRITENVIQGSGPILSDDQIEHLFRQGLAIEADLRGPQDIEFVISDSDEEGEKGKTYFIQTRPL
jgi:pyruvate,water dikinase